MTILREAVENTRKFYISELTKAGVLKQSEKELTLTELIQQYNKLKVNLKISQFY